MKPHSYKYLLIIYLLPLLAFGQSYTVTPARNGFVVLSSGDRKEGEIRLKIVDRKDTTEIRYKGANKEKATYSPDQLKDFGTDPYLISEVKNNNKDQELNFHPGYILLWNGEKREGKVAARKKEPNESHFKNFGPVAVNYANEKDEITMFWAEPGQVTYYVQVIDGVEHHYIHLEEYFLPIGSPKGRFSYFRNPDPTHVREGLTNLTKGIAAQVTNDMATRVAATEFLESYKATGNYTLAAMNADEIKEKNEARLERLEAEGEGVIFFEEYFIIDNKERTRSVVYKKNIAEVLTTLLNGCNLDEKAINKVSDVKELEEVMVFLEKSACN